MRTIPITARHIANGKPRDCTFCPVAVALEEATGHEWIVTSETCTYSVGSLVLALPAEVRQFIADFDAGKSVKPMEFELPLEGKS